MKHFNESRRESDRRGATLLVAAIMIAVLGGLAAAIVSLMSGHSREANSALASMRAYYAAEAGLSEAYLELVKGGDGQLGSEDDPVSFAQASYWVTCDEVAPKKWSLISNGEKAGARARHEFLVRMVPNGFFQFGIFGDQFVHLDSNAFVDSFDATDGTYASQYDPGEGCAGTYGTIGSNGDISLDANVEIHGGAHCGPTGTLDDDAPKTEVTGSTSPAKEPVAMPPIEVPTLPSLGSKTLTKGTTTISKGSYHYSSLTVKGGKLQLVGPCVLVLDAFELKASTALEIDATAGPVEIYGTGNFVLASNSSVTTKSGSAEDISVKLTGDTEGKPPAQIDLSSNAKFTGTIYAPNAHVDIHSNFEVFGSVVAQSVDLDSNAKVHFDESLLFDDDLPPEYEVMLWRPLSKGAEADAIL